MQALDGPVGRHRRRVSITFDHFRSPEALTSMRPILAPQFDSLAPSLCPGLCLSITRAPSPAHYPRSVPTQRARRTPHLIKREEDHAKDDAKEIAGKAPI